MTGITTRTPDEFAELVSVFMESYDKSELSNENARFWNAYTAVLKVNIAQNLMHEFSVENGRLFEEEDDV